MARSTPHRVSALIAAAFALVLVASLLPNLPGGTASAATRESTGWTGRFYGRAGGIGDWGRLWGGTITANSTAYYNVSGTFGGSGSGFWQIGWVCNSGPGIPYYDGGTWAVIVLTGSNARGSRLDPYGSDRFCAVYIGVEPTTAYVDVAYTSVTIETPDTAPTGGITPSGPPPATPSPRPSAYPSPGASGSPQPSVCFVPLPSGQYGPPVPAPCPTPTSSAPPACAVTVSMAAHGPRYDWVPTSTCTFHIGDKVRVVSTNSVAPGSNYWRMAWRPSGATDDSGASNTGTNLGTGTYDYDGTSYSRLTGAGWSNGTQVQIGAYSYWDYSGTASLTFTLLEPWDGPAPSASPTPTPSGGASSSPGLCYSTFITGGIPYTYVVPCAGTGGGQVGGGAGGGGTGGDPGPAGSADPCSGSTSVGCLPGTGNGSGGGGTGPTSSGRPGAGGGSGLGAGVADTCAASDVTAKPGYATIDELPVWTSENVLDAIVKAVESVPFAMLNLVKWMWNFAVDALVPGDRFFCLLDLVAEQLDTTPPFSWFTAGVDAVSDSLAYTGSPLDTYDLSVGGVTIPIDAAGLFNSTAPTLSQYRGVFAAIVYFALVLRFIGMVESVVKPSGPPDHLFWQ